MPKKINRKFTVIRDTREQEGWLFEESEVCNGTVIRQLITGDYAIESLENVLCIERKKSISELNANLNEERFERELERMLLFEHRFIVCEFPFQHIMTFPKDCNIPFKIQQSIKVTSKFLLKRISEIQLNYGVNIIYAGSAENAKTAALSLMKRVHEKNS